MTPTELRTLAADHGAIRAAVWRVSAALNDAAGEIERLRAALRDVLNGGDGQTGSEFSAVLMLADQLAGEET